MIRRVLLASVDFQPAQGGIASYLHHLAEATTALGVEVRVLAPRLEGASRLGDSAHYRVERDQRSNPSARTPLGMRRQDGILRALFDDQLDAFEPDALLLGHPFHYGTAGLERGRARRIPVGAMFYGAELRAQLLASDPWIRRLRSRWLNSGTLRDRTLALARGVDRIFTCSHYTADLVKRTSSPAPVSIVCAGLPVGILEREAALSDPRDVGGRSKRRERIAAEVGIESAPRGVVGFLGRLVPGKNAAALVDALVHLEGVDAWIIGEGPERASLERRAKHLGVTHRVRFFGGVDDARKWELLRGMDALCLPSVPLPDGSVEGFGIVLLEAAAAGAVPVANRAGGMPDAVTHEETGLLVDASDPRALAGGIERIFSDRGAAADWVWAARARIGTTFRWDRIAATVIADLETHERSSARA